MRGNRAPRAGAHSRYKIRWISFGRDVKNFYRVYRVPFYLVVDRFNESCSCVRTFAGAEYRFLPRLINGKGCLVTYYRRPSARMARTSSRDAHATNRGINCIFGTINYLYAFLADMTCLLLPRVSHFSRFRTCCRETPTRPVLM